MRKCKTCGMYLWLSWLTMGWPWQKKLKKFKDAEDCSDLVPASSFVGSIIVTSESKEEIS